MLKGFFLKKYLKYKYKSFFLKYKYKKNILNTA